MQLEESRAALGILLDQSERLQEEPALAASVGLTGGALELRWRRAARRTEQEVQRCRDIPVVRARWDTLGNTAIMCRNIKDDSAPGGFIIYKWPDGFNYCLNVIVWNNRIRIFFFYMDAKQNN